jgi:hypothetical protein
MGGQGRPRSPVGPFKAGLSWYKNLSTGQNGGEADLNVGIINVQADNATPPGGSFGGTTEGTQVKFSVLGFEKNLSTGEWSFKPSHTFKLGLQLGIGFEVSFNSDTFNQISGANDVCRARGGR